MRNAVSLMATVVVFIWTSFMVPASTNVDNLIIKDGINVIEIELEGKTFNFLYDERKSENVIDKKSVTIIKALPYDKDRKNYTTLESEIFSVQDFTIAKDNIARHTGERIDGVINSTTLNNLNEKSVKLKNYKSKE